MRTGTIYEQLWIIGGIIFGTDGQVVLLMAMVMLFYHSNFADSKNDVADLKNGTINRVQFVQESEVCLLYTSDAADDLLCVDLGGRRIIKKKTL